MSSITMSQKASKAKNPELNQEQLLPDLPSEIIINILSKLSVRTVTTCKFVCKLWLNLINSPEFVKSHLAESKHGLVVNLRKDSSTLFQITEFEDSLDFDTHELHYNPIINLDFRDFIDIPNALVGVRCVANGFLFVMVMNTPPHPYYICNPVTREYIKLPNPIPEESVYSCSKVVAYGFGVSKWTAQYKLIRIFHGSHIRNGTRGLSRISKFICQVYTLGTGSWRSIKPVVTLKYQSYDSGTFLNGILHWLVVDLKGCHWISCFDLETELFCTFSPPPDLHGGDPDFWHLDLVASGDYLYLCDNRPKSNENEIVVWLMKEYGVDKSWTKAFVINRTTDFANALDRNVCPIKVYEHGGIVMVSSYGFFYYSNETKTATDIGMFGQLSNIAMLCRPNFLSLRSFPMENTKSF